MRHMLSFLLLALATLEIGCGGSSPSDAVNIDAPVSAAAASRFLSQATFGPTPALIAQVSASGYSAFIANQFNQPSSTYPNPSDTDLSTNSPAPYQQAFLTNALNAPDQLRQRVAFALQKIWVVSWVVVNRDEGYLSYLRMHQTHAFDNYREIMENVTLNPAMGQYQDIANNDKANPALGISCNENYGRELLQLFTIGVWDLSSDGTFKRDAQGNLIQSYDPVDVVAANACAMSGWTYANAPGQTRNWPRPINYGAPLEPVESHHDNTVARTLLRGFVLAPGGTARVDLKFTLDNVFADPNTAPFVSKLLIQQFTTSNPTPAYVQRVAQAFASGTAYAFGSGQRGDMKAIIAAILLDPEARAGDTNPPTAGFGKLREPVLFVTGILRAIGATSDGSGLRAPLNNMGQNLFFPPTVFSYFSPEFQLPGSSFLAPEFQIQTTATVFQRYNFVNTLVFGTNTGTTVNLTPLINLSQNPGSAGQLLDTLDLLFLHGSMSSQTRQSILNAVNSVAASTNQLRDRARTALYLVASSSQYQVQH